MLYLASVYIHLLAAVIWVGGMFFLALVVVPGSRQETPERRARLFDILGRRFRSIGWLCIGLLVLTGLYNASLRGVTVAGLLDGSLLASPFGRLLLLKLALVLIMLLLSLQHDLIVGPASTRAILAAPTSPAAQHWRRRASWLARLNALLALIVLALAVGLVRPIS